MRSRKELFFVIVFALGFLGSCGEKKPSQKTLLPSRETGCYDQLGEKVSRYFSGSISESEWQTTFDCVADQVGFFKKYVAGSGPGSTYTREDIAALVRNFLVVKSPISDGFIGSIFEIKASVVGGSPQTITHSEIDEFLRLSELLRRETTTILPAIREKVRNPQGPQLIRLADAITVFGERVAQYLASLNGTIDVHKNSYIPFVRELISLHGGDPSLVDTYGDFVRNLKVVVASGSPEVIESKKWSTLVREGAAFGGALLAYRDMEDQKRLTTIEEDEFQIALARRIQGHIERVISLHGSGIPLELFYPVVDTIPWKALDSEKRAAIKHDLNAIVTRALKGGVPGWFTPAAIRTVVDLFEVGKRQEIHIERVLFQTGLEPKQAEFEAAARQYLFSTPTAEDRAEINRMISTSKTYLGLFTQGAGEILFDRSIRGLRSRNHLIRMSWFRILIDHIYSVYATGPEISNGKKLAQQSDLEKMTQDGYQILLKWKMAHPDLTFEQMAAKRFREANLFMPVSNGDAYMDPVEATYYFAYLFSSGSFSGRVFRGVTHSGRDWSPCPIVGVDELGQDAVTAKCFREVYFGHPTYFWSRFPTLQKEFSTMGEGKRIEVALAMEKAARRGGVSDHLPIGKYDIDSFAALPHYVEGLMERFDRNRDERLDRDELLKSAFPIFRSTLAKSAKTNNAALLRAILTYIVHHGRAPRGTWDLIWWKAQMPFVKIEADRSSLYKVVAVMSEPIAID